QIQSSGITTKTGVPFRRRSNGDSSAPEIVSSESALLSMLARGLLPRDMVRLEDFSSEYTRNWASQLLSGETPVQILERIDDEVLRNLATQAFSYDPIPESSEEAIGMAEGCIRELRKGRMDSRANQIQPEIGSMDAEQRKALYQQIAAINQATDA
ncbi:MAG: hypothetical protein IJ074_01115, partial [Clostridia bacterium]|nr:hypothetical protein [Clostridia bacterium]